jgi:hypothetical protein
MILRKLIMLVGATLLAAYAALMLFDIEPLDRRPGTKISGTEMPLPSDLSFAQAFNEVTLETQPWWGIPFSVTTVVTRAGDHLYVPSLYDSPQDFPGTKFWNKVVAANPEVRVRFGQKIHLFNIYPVTDAVEYSQVFTALGNKYPFWREQIQLDDRAPRFALLRLESRSTQ